MGRDGIAKPCHGPRISMPAGRTRCTASAAAAVPSATTSIAAIQTNRCRQRRVTSSTARLASHAICSASGLARLPTARMASVSQPVRSWAIASRMARSATSSAPAGREAMPVTARNTSTSSASISQNRPVVLSWRGSGGGSPEGRRRRRLRVIPA
jgi:hypothetical protein